MCSAGSRPVARTVARTSTSSPTTRRTCPRRCPRRHRGRLRRRTGIARSTAARTSRAPKPGGRCRPGRSWSTRRRRPGSPVTVEHPCAKNQRSHSLRCAPMRDRALEYLDSPTDDGRLELPTCTASTRASGENSSGPLNDYTITRRGRRRTDSGAKYPLLGGFRSDPSWWNVAALEDFDDDTHDRDAGTDVATRHRHRCSTRLARPGRRRSSRPSRTRWRGCIASTRRYVAGQLGVDHDIATSTTGDVAFENPTTQQWELAAHYLAGDVVGKLDTARAAAGVDPARFGRNVDALRRSAPDAADGRRDHPEFGVTWLSGADIAPVPPRPHRRRTTVGSCTTRRRDLVVRRLGRRRARPTSAPHASRCSNRSSRAATPAR